MAKPLNPLKAIKDKSSAIDINAIAALVTDDMKAVNLLIQNKLHSEVALISQIGQHIVHSGGKRLRPLLVLLSARAFAYEGNQHIDLASIIEFIHTATLIHDDVVDASELRRGQTTANSIWGNEASVLVGDFLYSRAFEMMVDVGNLPIMAIMAKATNTIAEGEILQLLNCHDPDTTEQRYLDVIHSKTAKLFEAAAQIGALLSQQPIINEQAMMTYGMHLGTAFQLIDDVLDYSANPSDTGKNFGDDLSEGKPTLPLIHAMTHGSKKQADLIRQAIEKGGHDYIEPVMAAIESTDALTYTAHSAEKEVQKAIQAIATIPESSYKEALITLAHFAVERKY